jgi:hypothetical protein
MIRVIKRHLKLGYSLMAVEAALGQGARVDLLFKHPRSQRRIVEVKSAKELSEFHRLQAALYWVPEAGETVLSNGSEDIVLPADYITSVQEKAHMVRKLLLEHPDVAATTFNPAPAVCRICANNRCPFSHASNEAL